MKPLSGLPAPLLPRPHGKLVHAKNRPEFLSRQALATTHGADQFRESGRRREDRVAAEEGDDRRPVMAMRRVPFDLPGFVGLEIDADSRRRAALSEPIGPPPLK